MKLLVSLLVYCSLAIWINADQKAETEKRDDSTKSLQLETRIVNGNNANQHEYPYQVSLRLLGRHICGGSLIKRNWVLTAAHCIRTRPIPSLYTVVVGAHSRNGYTPFRKVFAVKRLFWHHHYFRRHLRYDVGLLELNGTVTLSRGVQLANLPPKGSRAPIGKICYGTGWGHIRFRGPFANILQEAPLRIGSFHHCRRLNGKFVHDPTMICVGAQGKAACQGDSGGPLSCKENGKWIVRGISSWVIRGCITSKYSVYSRVSSFMSWIHKITGGRGSDGCKNYRILNMRDRSQIPRGKVLKCDQLSEIVNGQWHRFMGAAGTRMPTKKVPIDHCGTHAPGWLNGRHPSVGQGIVSRQVCFHWSNNPCQWKRIIQVRNCGGFYVYKLYKPPACWLRYCGNAGSRCPKIPCYHGGSQYCVGGQARCRCHYLYYGSRCQCRRLDNCPRITCYNGGSRYCKGNSAYCRCRRGYTGGRCQCRKIGCPLIRCFNGGKRYCVGRSARCWCPSSFRGKHCRYRRSG